MIIIIAVLLYYYHYPFSCFYYFAITADTNITTIILYLVSLSTCICFQILLYVLGLLWKYNAWNDFYLFSLCLFIDVHSNCVNILCTI